MAKKNIIMFGIDCQIDFMDLPGSALPVPGADQDMKRAAALATRLIPVLSDIVLTMDSHNVIDIGHSAWWVDNKGNHPSPFTIITSADLDAGKWRPRFPTLLQWAKDYTASLEAQGKYPVIIWPYHCIIGSAGHAFHPDIFELQKEWSIRRGGVPTVQVKGTNPNSEHYSAIKTEVIVANDPSTHFNSTLVHEVLGKADEVLVCGEALSHCVMSTLEDVFDALPVSELHKFILLEDCMSSVTGFEQQGLDFLARARARGVNVIKSTEY